MTKPKKALPDLSIDQAIDEFAADLRIDKSPKTILTYTEACRLFAAFHPGNGLHSITADSIRDWLLDLRARGRSEGTLFNRYNGLRALLTWAVGEGIIRTNPAQALPPPKPQPKPIPILRLPDLQALIKACDGPTFEHIRDTAILRLLIDTGMRRAECAGLTVDELDFDQEVAIVTGKGNRVRACPFGPRTAKALRRYLRARSIHDYAEERPLWLGRRGPIAADGILHILRRRARQAGVDGRVFVHQLRHTWAHEALSSGLQEGDVMRLGGWKDRDMLSRYAASGADERARKAYRPVSLGDRI